MKEFERKDGESIQEYTIRIGYACTDHKLTWEQAASLLNKEAGTSYGESKFRKHFKSWKSGYEYAINHFQPESVKNDFRRLKIEQVKLRDERTALNKLYREVARSESIKSIIESNIKPYDKSQFLNVVQYKKENPELIVCLSDIHAGSGIDSAWNKFDNDIMKQRLEIYVAQIFNIVSRHEISKINVFLLGDLINGHIHINSRVTNKESTVTQIMNVSEAVSNFIAELYKVCSFIDVYSVSGNHSRIFHNKEECTSGDNLEDLIPFYIKARLNGFDGVNIITDKLDPTFGTANICGNLVVYAHGDKDSPTNVVEKIGAMIRCPIDIVLLGHRHTNGLTSVKGAKVIDSGCVCGPDEYAIGIRTIDVPQQAVAVIDCHGVECLYDIKLEKRKEVI